MSARIRIASFCLLLAFAQEFALAKPKPTAPPPISPATTVETAFKHANERKYFQADALAKPLTSVIPKGNTTKEMWDYYTRTQTVVQISVTNEVFKWQKESGLSGFGISQMGTAGVDLTLTYKDGGEHFATVVLLKTGSLPWQILKIGDRVALTNHTDSAEPPLLAKPATEGKLLETHTEPGKPDIAIYMTGFVDSSFHAYLKEGDSTQLILRDLACMKSDFNFSTNSIGRKTTTKQISNASAMQLYEVFWSGDGNRFGISFCGYFIAAYDRSTRQRLRYSTINSSQHSYRAFDAGVARFLKGEDVSEETIEDLRKALSNSLSEGPP